MQPAPSKPQSSAPGESPACSDCKRLRSQLVDLCLELQWRRELQGQIDEDQVELVARNRLDFYRKLGGTRLDLASFRAEVRHELAGEEL